MTKEEAEAYDKDPNITIMFADSDSDNDSEYVDIEYSSMKKTDMRFSHSNSEIPNYFQVAPFSLWI